MGITGRLRPFDCFARLKKRTSDLLSLLAMKRALLFAGLMALLPDCDRGRGSQGQEGRDYKTRRFRGHAPLIIDYSGRL